VSAEIRCAGRGCGLLFFEANGPRPEFYDREGHAYCSRRCAYSYRHHWTRLLRWPLRRSP
jgi:hypothetical protein